MKSTHCENVLDQCAHGIIGINQNGNIIIINKKAKEVVKFPDRFTKDIHMMDLLPVTCKLIHQTMRTGKPYFGHQVEENKENLIVSINPIKNGEEITGAVCSFVNVNEFESVAHKLDFIRFLDEQFKTVFKESFDGIWLADGQGRVIDINKSSEKIMGLSRSKVIGKKISELVENGLYTNSMTDEVIRTKKKISQLQTATLTGKRILCTGIPVLDKKGEVAMVVINERDLSHLIATQQELETVRQEKDRYKDELNALIMKELQENQIVAEDSKMQHIIHMAVKFAQMSISDILILGESGTGKGLMAKFIHNSGKRSDKHFIQINCAAIPESILEAELFGYEKGAFTGAKDTGKPGLIELAHEGILFLDEIGELSLPGQAKLLKYLDDHEIMRVGGTKARKIDCIIIAATNQNLEQLVVEKKFRGDLLFRLNSISLTLPPLRERPEDIFELTHHFLKLKNKKFNLNKKLNPLTIAMMQTYSFPGNIRELKNIIKKGVIMSETDDIDKVVLNCMGKEIIDEVAHILQSGQDSVILDYITAAFEKEVIKNAMKKHRSTRDLAKYLNVSQPTIVRKLKKHGLSTNNAD